MKKEQRELKFEFADMVDGKLVPISKEKASEEMREILDRPGNMDRLAEAILEGVRAFYAKPENVKAFQEWEAERKKQGIKTDE